jgi:hypothetical protein
MAYQYWSWADQAPLRCPDHSVNTCFEKATNWGSYRRFLALAIIARTGQIVLRAPVGRVRGKNGLSGPCRTVAAGRPVFRMAGLLQRTAVAQKPWRNQKLA